MLAKYEYRNNPIYVINRNRILPCPVRFHKQLEILYVRSGCLQVNVDGKSETIRENEMYIAFPNVLHSVNQGEASGMLIIVDGEMFPHYADVLARFKPRTSILRTAELPGAVPAVLERISQWNDSGESPHRQAILTGYITALLGELLENLPLTERDSDSDLIQKLVLFFLEHYTQEISLEDVARELNYSKCYISHLIADTFQCNFRTLINSYRVSLAQSLLLTTQKTVSEVAGECGFQNQSSFNRIFLKYSGKTPSLFRSQHDLAVDEPKVYYAE